MTQGPSTEAGSRRRATMLIWGHPNISADLIDKGFLKLIAALRPRPCIGSSQQLMALVTQTA